MTLRVFAIWDSKAEAYMQPFLMQTKGQAIRAFTDLVRDTKSNVSQHPEDFTLFELAEYDEQQGNYSNHETKINLGGAWELPRETNSQNPFTNKFVESLQETRSN